MKFTYRSLLNAFALLLFFSACKKEETKFGTVSLFMPQASMTSDGANGTFSVPAINNAFNYTIDTANQVLHIPLSVLRSGMESREGYTVKIRVNTDTVSKILQSGAFSNAMALPATAYTLESEVTVSEGSLGESFDLAVNMAAIRSNYGKKLLVAVEIYEPSKYSLNKAKSITVVNINSEQLLGPGGRFDPNAYYYIRLHLNGSQNVLGVENNSNIDGALLQQQVKDTNNKYQQWKIVSTNNIFRLENRGSGKVIGPSFDRQPQYGWPDASKPWYGAAQRTRNDADATQRWMLENVPNTLQFAIVNVGLGPDRQLFDVWGYDATEGKTNIALMGNRTLDGNDVFYFDKHGQ